VLFDLESVAEKKACRNKEAAALRCRTSTQRKLASVWKEALGLLTLWLAWALLAFAFRASSLAMAKFSLLL
jgi:hypothetical protein